MPDAIATVAHLYLYPVKSMAGVPLEEAHVGLDGILGDRQYAFVRANQAATNNFPWMTPRQDSRMLAYKPRFTQLPTPGEPEPPLRVHSPGGNVHEVDDAALIEELTSLMGHPLLLLRSNRGMFDAQHLSLFSLASLRALSEETASPLDLRRFRANIYIEPASPRAYDEDQWTDSLLQIGSEFLAAVTKRDSRCMVINLDPDTLKQNPAVLRTVAQDHQGRVGLYANVVSPGLIRVGDPVKRIAKPR